MLASTSMDVCMRNDLKKTAELSSFGRLKEEKLELHHHPQREATAPTQRTQLGVNGVNWQILHRQRRSGTSVNHPHSQEADSGQVRYWFNRLEQGIPSHSVISCSLLASFRASFESASPPRLSETRPSLSSASRPNDHMSDQAEESSVMELSLGTYVPNKPSSHTSRSCRQSDTIADARCDTNEETLQSHYTMEGGVCVYSEAVQVGLRSMADQGKSSAAPDSFKQKGASLSERALERVIEAGKKAKVAEKRVEVAEKLLVEERQRAMDAEENIARLKLELNEEIDKLFQTRYGHCVERLQELHLEYDLSGLVDDAEKNVDAEEENIEEAVDDALDAAIKEGLKATAEAIIGDTPIMPNTEET
ncbi:hypothetical protein Taro_055434 [Colocasia esculenta]|uniref:Uncharacterized protein n=1 Tax=Colocasia esculenta TaxID=4460 RepID=A0A843XTF3_COLES|nr:hypothetical protein [Colocasia esculenta]